MGKSKDINSIEQKYVNKLSKIHKPEKKLCYEKARIICKYAQSCSASIKSQKVRSGKLYFVFQFKNSQFLQEFVTDAPYNTNVSTDNLDYYDYLEDEPKKRR